MKENCQNIILQAKEIKKSFYSPQKIEIIRGLDLTLHQGESIAIIGRSGEGKSTLLQILGTLDSPCSGSLEIAAQKVTAFNKSYIRNHHLAFIFQSFHLLEDYTAIENVLMPARIARQNISKGSVAYSQGLHLLDHVGLSQRAHFHTKLLSGGEKQRVAIARALCNHPDVILADEPSGNLDKESAKIIHELLLNYVRQQNKSLIVVTHDLDLAKLCDKTYILQNGKISL